MQFRWALRTLALSEFWRETTNSERGHRGCHCTYLCRVPAASGSTQELLAFREAGDPRVRGPLVGSEVGTVESR